MGSYVSGRGGLVCLRFATASAEVVFHRLIRFRLEMNTLTSDDISDIRWGFVQAERRAAGFPSPGVSGPILEQVELTSDWYSKSIGDFQRLRWMIYIATARLAKLGNRLKGLQTGYEPTMYPVF